MTNIYTHTYTHIHIHKRGPAQLPYLVKKRNVSNKIMNK